MKIIIEKLDVEIIEVSTKEEGNSYIFGSWRIIYRVEFEQAPLTSISGALQITQLETNIKLDKVVSYIEEIYKTTEHNINENSRYSKKFAGTTEGQETTN